MLASISLSDVVVTQKLQIQILFHFLLGAAVYYCTYIFIIMPTKVILHVYDLIPHNDYGYQFGVGAYHSGVELNGVGKWYD